MYLRVDLKKASYVVIANITAKKHVSDHRRLKPTHNV